MRGRWHAVLHKNRTVLPLKRIHLLSVRTEIPEGGVVVQGGANFRAGSTYWPEVATGGKRPFIVSPFDQFMNE